ncbi:MAG: Uma2 family endonuclease [Acidobacteriaceae bacterium]|nr:Uma2 family endonuclease [Acidobacteriaceae bacterium]
MSTILEIPIPKVQNTVVIDPPLTDEEFERMCMTAEAVKLERTKDGKIVVNAPAGGDSSTSNTEIVSQLRAWWRTTNSKGAIYGPDSSFFLPDGAMLGQDAAYITAEQMRGLSRAQRAGFVHRTPAFVIELLSPSDSVPATKEKMEVWIANGAQLGWLIDPRKRQVHIYEPGKTPRVERDKTVAGSGPVEGFVLDLNPVWECFEDS